MKKINLTLFTMFTSATVFASAKANEAAVVPKPSIGLSTSELLIIALLIFAVCLLVVAITLFNAFKIMLKEQTNPTPYQKYIPAEPLEYTEWLKQQKIKSSIWTKLLSLKPIEEEKNMVIPHAYDGIHELNNPVPAWFNVLFYGTMIFAAGYLYYYHVAEYGPRQDTEYENEMAKAAADRLKFLAKSTTSVDENSVKVDKTLIVSGKGIFNANCIACHGEQGQGLVGPNLVDEFWLHGGSINDVFKTIKYGVPEKGMVSWEKNLSSKNIAEVTNYIMSLQGSKPANAKAPQGEKYVPKILEDSLKNETIDKK